MDIQNVTVVGAGNMGSGIAQSWAMGGFHVSLHDITEEAIQGALERIEKPLRKRVDAGRMNKDEVDRIMAHLHAAPDLEAATKDADLVIEAVFEDLTVKGDLFARLDGLCPEKTVLATNTSSFLVAELAKRTKRANRCIGLHYFFPAAINKLVEVIATEDTDRKAFQAVYDGAKRCGKVAIETSDASGFCVNRFFVPWINEACRMLDEGFADIPTIEAAAKESFGIGMGPFELMNVTGVPISLHAQTTLHQEFGAFYEPAKGLRAQVKKGENWNLEGAADSTRQALVGARLCGVVFGIACHLVEANIASVRDTDRGATVGLRWRKGPFAMMNEQGLQRALVEVEKLHAKWGDAFGVPAQLKEHAKANTQWHLPSVALDMQGPVAWIRFDRPEALNALDANVLSDLEQALDTAHEKQARVLVLTGSGKAFIAGADIPTMAALDLEGAKRYTDLGHRVLQRLCNTPCPVIMALNGFAFGGGLELALCGDLLYASDRASMALPEVGLGIHPGFGGTQRLPRRIGMGAAKDLVMTGRTVDAKEALSLGLVNAVYPHDELAAEVAKIAASLAGKAPLAMAGAKRAMDEGFSQDLATALRTEQESVVLLFDTKDKQEGLQAFQERRKAKFTGA